MTEQLKSLLRDLITAQDTVTDRNLNAEFAETPEARADLIAEMRWAQGLRDAYRDRILAEFVKLRAERDRALAACEAALEYVNEAVGLGIDEPAPLKALRLQNILYAALSRAEGES